MDVSNTFATTPIVVGKVYAADYTPPTPAYMTQAVSDMETALTAATGYRLSYSNNSNVRAGGKTALCNMD